MILVFLLVALLITLFLWSLRAPRRRPPTPETISACEQTGRSHATYLHVIRQALAAQDLDYLRERGYRQLLGRVRHERRHAALVYLAALRGDFRRLLLFARVIASLSPEVQVAHEFQRLRLMLQFSWRFELIRIRLFC